MRSATGHQASVSGRQPGFQAPPPSQYPMVPPPTGQSMMHPSQIAGKSQSHAHGAPPTLQAYAPGPPPAPANANYSTSGPPKPDLYKKPNVQGRYANPPGMQE